MTYLSCLQQDLPLLLFLPLLLQLIELLKELQLSSNITALLIAVVLVLKDGIYSRLHQKKSTLNIIVEEVECISSTNLEVDAFMLGYLGNFFK